MLSLFIAERCSINTCDNLKDIVINCHTKKEVSYSYFAQNVEWKKSVVAKTNIFYTYLLILSARPKLDMHIYKLFLITSKLADFFIEFHYF